MFELVLDVTDRFLNLRESVRTPARIRPYPTGRLIWVALSQALRAPLRSHRPSGTKAIRPSKGLALSFSPTWIKARTSNFANLA
jgi:hypothetical protein